MVTKTGLVAMLRSRSGKEPPFLLHFRFVPSRNILGDAELVRIGWGTDFGRNGRYWWMNGISRPPLRRAPGIAFTVALFFTTAAFPPGPLLGQTKMGALLSLGAGALAFLVATVRRRAQAIVRGAHGRRRLSPPEPASPSGPRWPSSSEIV